MNQKESSRWELRLGLFQVVVLLGLLMGLLTCVFFLGYFSGRQVGHETALSANLSNTIKLPIGIDDREQLVDEGAADRVASEVYAKLNQNRLDSGKTAANGDSATMPSLGVIDSTQEAPLINQDNSPGTDSPIPENVQVAEQVIQHPVSETREQLLKDVIADEVGANGVAAVAGVATSQPIAPTPSPTNTTAPAPATPTAKPIVTKAAQQVQQNLPKGWFAQVAAPKKKEDAAALASQLRRSGFAVIVEVATVRGEQYHRVLAGPENARAQAEKLIEQLMREPYISTKPFLRQIK